MGGKFVLNDQRGNPVNERRNPERKDLHGAVKVRFSVEYEGEIVNISPKGLALRFHPLRSESFIEDKTIPLQMDMAGKIISLNGTVRQMDEKFGFITIGMEYDRDAIALFDLQPESTEPTD